MSTETPHEPGLRTPFPGIVIMTGEAGLPYAKCEDMERVLHQHYGIPLKPYCRVGMDKILVAYGISSRPSAHNYFNGEDGVSVIFDGYISDYLGTERQSDSETSFAETIAELYRSSGLSFLNDLRGSFICMIADRRQEKVYLFSDRQGSRPMFYRELADGSVVFAPQVKFLAALEPRVTGLNISAVGQFLIRGCFYGTDTLYENIHKFPQATVTTFTRANRSSRRYWSYQFKDAPKALSEEELIDEFDEHLSRATRRLLAIAGRPVLLLSGGLDSRLMLAYLRQEGMAQMPALSYMVHDSDGEDHLVAKRLSDYCGLEHQIYEIHESDYSAIAQKEVLAVDGRVQVLDSPSNRWEYIGTRYDSIFIGDECFGWGRTTANIAEALDVIGWFNLDKTHRISDWLRPGVRRAIYAQVKVTQDYLVAQSGETDPNNIKDKLYYTERMGNMLNGYGARRLWLMEQARPLLDEDLMEFISTLSIDQRQNKSLAWQLIATKFPDLHSIPYSKRDSVPWWPPQFVRITASDRALYDFIVSNLTDNLAPQLAELFDQKRLAKTIPALFRNSEVPPLRQDWWVHLPGLWRFSRDRHDRVGAVRGALRLLGLTLYLNG